MLCQNVVALDEEGGDGCHLIADSGIEQGVVLFLLSVTCGNVESTDVLESCSCCPFTLVVVGTEVELPFWRSFDGRVHAEVGVVGVETPMRRENEIAREFQTPVLEIACVHVAWLAINADGVDEVIPLGIEDIDTEMSSTFDTLCEGQLVVHHALWLQICSGWWKHIHLTDDRVAETFAHQCLEVRAGGKVEGEAYLWHEFCTDDGMMVNTETSIGGEPRGDALTEVEISSHFVSVLLYGSALFFRDLYLIRLDRPTRMDILLC